MKVTIWTLGLKSLRQFYSTPSSKKILKIKRTTTMTNEMSKRFDEIFSQQKTAEGRSYLYDKQAECAVNPLIMKDYIQSEIDLAVAEERKRIVEGVGKLPRLNLENFVAETGTEIRGMGSAKKLVSFDDILSLINKTQ